MLSLPLYTTMRGINVQSLRMKIVPRSRRRGSVGPRVENGEKPEFREPKSRETSSRRDSQASCWRREGPDKEGSIRGPRRATEGNLLPGDSYISAECCRTRK